MSERMFIKEEKEEFGEAMSSASSFSTSLSTSLSYSTSSPSLSVSVPPTQRVLPSTPSLRSVTGLGLFNGPSSKPETVVDKTKKFLAALVKFATSVSPAVGTNVRKLVFRLATGCLGVPEFLHQLQLQTQCPVRPYVLPFLQSSVPLIVGQIQMLALASGATPQSYLATHEGLLEPPEGVGAGSGLEASEIFEGREARKRKMVEQGEQVGGKVGRTGGASLLSPPLHASLYPPAAQPQSEGLPSPDQGGGGHQEDEWKNIQVMLNCILGMVEKTQSALTILQQRQSEAANLRTTEEAVADVQARANLAIMEVKQAAMEEIRAARASTTSGARGHQAEEGKEGGQCWNCGRPGSETCSGCGLARYCGAFCQHKDWEDHARVCRSSPSSHPSSPPPALQASRAADFLPSRPHPSSEQKIASETSTAAD